MTGPEHYTQAEQMLTRAAQAIGGFSGGPGTAEMARAMEPALRMAQVHATLALAAATAFAPSHDRRAWHAVAGTSTPTAGEK